MPCLITGGIVLGTTWKHEVICLMGPFGFTPKGLVWKEKGKQYFANQLGEWDYQGRLLYMRICSLVMGGTWSLARSTLLKLGQRFAKAITVRNYLGNEAPWKATAWVKVWLWCCGSLPCTEWCWALPRCDSRRAFVYCEKSKPTWGNIVSCVAYWTLCTIQFVLLSG